VAEAPGAGRGDDEEKAPASAASQADDEETRAARRTWVVLQYLGLPLAAAIWFLSRSTYYDGYAAALGIPPDLDYVPHVSVSDLMYWLGSSAMTVSGSVLLVRRLHAFGDGVTGTITRRIRPTVIGIVLGLVGYIAIRSTVSLLITFGIIFWIVAAAIIHVVWTYPLYSQRRTRGYLAKLRAEDTAPVRSSSAPTPTRRGRLDIIGIVVWAGGWPAFWILALFVCVPSASYLIGKHKTQEKETWVVLKLTSPAESEGLWVVIGDRDGDLLTAQVVKRKLQSAFRYVKLDERPELEVRNLGQLEPVDPLPAPKAAPRGARGRGGARRGELDP
jgi:hypothetical protein